MDGFAGTTKLFRHVCRERRLAKRQRNFFPVVLSRTLTVSEPKYAALPLLSSCTSVTIDANSSQVSYITAPATRVPFARPRTTYSTCPLSPKTRRYGFRMGFYPRSAQFLCHPVLALHLRRHLLCHHVGHHFLKLPFLIALTDSVPSPSPHPAPDLIPGGCEVDIARSCDSLQQVLRHMYVCLCASVDAYI